MRCCGFDEEERNGSFGDETMGMLADFQDRAEAMFSDGLITQKESDDFFSWSGEVFESRGMFNLNSAFEICQSNDNLPQRRGGAELC